MEILKSQKFLLAIPSRWRSILLGVTFAAFISVAFTSNFAQKIVPNSSASFSSQLYILFFAGPSSNTQNNTTPKLSFHHPSVSTSSDQQNRRMPTNAGVRMPAPSGGGPVSDGTLSARQNASHGTQTDTQQHEGWRNDSKNGTAPGPESKSDPKDRVSLSGSNPLKRYVGSTCDLSLGRWARDDSYPLYKPGSCPFVDEGFNCHLNGRPDADYTKWRWAPRDCTIPRLNGTDMLEKLRGKRLVFVGDSLNRNQWESTLCILRESLPNKDRIEEIHGGRISKLPGAYVFKFLDYDCRVEFYTSHFLVDEEEGADPTKFVVRLDKVDKSERRWRKANVLVFNTGHWWTPDKIGEGENCFREGAIVHEKLDVMVAYHKAIQTWANWIQRYVDPANTRIFFRGYSPAHYIGGQWNSGGQCHNETQPIFNESFLNPYPDIMQVVDETIQHMTLPVQILNITRLSDFRKDAHPAVYGHRPEDIKEYQDCSHWCLPGIPDTWNELLYFSLFVGG